MDEDLANSEIAPLSHLYGMFAAAAMTFTALHVLQYAGNPRFFFTKVAGALEGSPVFH